MRMPKEKINLICRLHKENKSYGIIAVETELNRNQIAGIIFRLQKNGKLEKRNKRHGKIQLNSTRFEKGHMPANKGKIMGKREKNKIIADAKEPISDGKSILELTNNCCRFPLWPLGEIGDKYCGELTLPEVSWCPYHAKRVYSSYDPT